MTEAYGVWVYLPKGSALKWATRFKLSPYGSRDYIDSENVRIVRHYYYRICPLFWHNIGKREWAKLVSRIVEQGTMYAFEDGSGFAETLYIGTPREVGRDYFRITLICENDKETKRYREKIKYQG
jgi:hypothetical protein